MVSLVIYITINWKDTTAATEELGLCRVGAKVVVGLNVRLAPRTPFRDAGIGKVSSQNVLRAPGRSAHIAVARAVLDEPRRATEEFAHRVDRRHGRHGIACSVDKQDRDAGVDEVEAGEVLAGRGNKVIESKPTQSVRIS